MPLVLTATAFANQAEIPEKYTCQGEDVSPALAWAGVPENAESLVLIVDDPDAPDPAAPKMTWVHWVLYNIPATSQGLAEKIPAADLPAGTLEGKNDWNQTGYRGPCPPVGRHRYFFKLYALDIILPDLRGPNEARLEQAMAGHVIGKTGLVGTYQKTGRR